MLALPGQLVLLLANKDKEVQETAARTLHALSAYGRVAQTKDISQLLSGPAQENVISMFKKLDEKKTPTDAVIAALARCIMNLILDGPAARSVVPVVASDTLLGNLWKYSVDDNLAPVKPMILRVVSFLANEPTGLAAFHRKVPIEGYIDTVLKDIKPFEVKEVSRPKTGQGDKGKGGTGAGADTAGISLEDTRAISSALVAYCDTLGLILQHSVSELPEEIVVKVRQAFVALSDTVISVPSLVGHEELASAVSQRVVKLIELSPVLREQLCAIKFTEKIFNAMTHAGVMASDSLVGDLEKLLHHFLYSTEGMVSLVAPGGLAMEQPDI